MKRTLLIGAAASLMLAGCASAPPVVGVTPEPAAHAAVVDEQAQRIIEDTFAAIAAADKAHDPTLLGTRIGPDATAVRTAEYAVQNATGEAPDVLPSVMQRVYVTGSNTWPRMMAAVSEVPGENLTPVVYLWVQEAVDQPYQLRSWAHMIPGATLPAMPGSVDGAEQVPVGDTGAAPEPRATLESYLEYVRQGSSSELAAGFAPDSYAAQLFEARATLAQAAAAASGGYVDTIQPVIEQTFVLTSSDGGVLIFAPVAITSSFTVSGATLKVSDRDAPLLTGTPTSAVTYEYRDMVVLSVPLAEAGALPAVVAADHHLVQVRPS